MRLLDNIRSSFTFVVSVLMFGNVEELGIEDQVPLLPSSSNSINHGSTPGPIFKPPTGRLTGPGSDFRCNYTDMKGWEPCTTADDRGCWLRNPSTGQEWNIYTNYENVTSDYIRGINRTYVLNITDHAINADGLNFTEAKVFNEMYPGPWIQGCWGDVSIYSLEQRTNSLLLQCQF